MKTRNVMKKVDNKVNIPFIAVFAITILAPLANFAFAAPGDLDPTFGIGGKVVDDSVYGFNDVAIQPDGKIAAVGGGIVVARYNVDGSPDMTFGNTGKVLIDRSGLPIDVAIQPDGKILVASRNPDGEVYGELLRLNSDGSPDMSFGTNGVIVGWFLPSLSAVLQDGKLLIDQAANLLRFNADGSVDSSFNLCTPGVNAVYPYNRIESVVQADGKTLTVFNPGVGPGFGVFRCNTNGTLDAGFGSGGVVRTPMGSASAQSIAIQVDGKILVGGQSRSGADAEWKPTIVRYNPNGSLDTGFGTDGILTAPSTGTAYGYPPFADVVIQSDGKIVAFTTIGSDFALVRYDSNGSLDTTFGGGDGIATVDFVNSDNFSNGLALDGQGRAVVVGFSGDSAAIARILLAPKKPPFDFDGDGKTDIGVTRDNNGGFEWWISRSTDRSVFATPFGVNTDIPVPADYTGDGKMDIAVWRPSTGFWYLLKSDDLTFLGFPFGLDGDIPVPADFDGDGKADPAVFRPSTQTWWIPHTADSGTTVAQFGLAGDQPVVADYDGDGKGDIAITRLNGANKEWWIQRSSLGIFAAAFGTNGDEAVPGDYTGDGKADVAFWRPSDGNWYILRSEDFSYLAFLWGQTGDLPAPGDYDGDGKIDAAVFRPSQSTWFVNRTGGAGPLITNFGTSMDSPLAGVFVR